MSSVPTTGDYTKRKKKTKINQPPRPCAGALKHNTMKAGLFFIAALVAVTLLLAYLLRKWVRENVGNRRPEYIAPGEDFSFYERGQPRHDVCDRNHPDIGVIYTVRNKRVEYEQISKLV